MNALVRKEIRLILPAWAATMTLALVPWWFLPANPPWTDNMGAGTPVLMFFLFGALYLAISSFGQEFSLNTFPMLLAQPVQRRRLWTTKLLVLAAAFGTVLLALWVSWFIYVSGTSSEIDLPKVMLFTGVSTLILICGGLWTTLLVRQVSIAFWLTLLFPLALMGVAEIVLVLIHKPDQFPPQLAVAIAAIYSVAGFLWARRLFRRAEDVPWSGSAITIPTWRSSKTRARSGTSAPQRNTLVALIRKELHFQQLSLMIGGAVVLLQVAVIVFRIVHPPSAVESNTLVALLVCWFLLWLMTPFLIGSMAVAEERKLGTLESFLCLPTTRRAQFGVKLGVVLVLSLVLCAVIPWVLEGVMGDQFAVSHSIFKNRFGLKGLAAVSLFSISLALVSFYASTLARNTLQGLGAAFVLSFPVMGVGVWIASYTAGGSYHPFLNSQSPLAFYIGYPVIVLVALFLAFRNFRHLYVGWTLWIRNALTLLISLGAISLTTKLVYNRVWERFMTYEPRHGQAQLSGPIRPQVCLAWQHVFILLPDGRVWTGRNYEQKGSGEYWYTYTMDKPEETQTLVPSDGLFVDSRWTHIAQAQNQVFGIQSDGSLWRMFSRSPRPTQVRLEVKRVGTDSNWKTIAAGWNHFLALKSDGTLWGWGSNEDGQLGPGPKEVLLPMRIGEDSDWANAFVQEYAVSVGIKRDGSVWKWGALSLGPTGRPDNGQSSHHPEPVRWGEGGTNWIAIAGPMQTDVIVRQDGTMAVSGTLRGDVFGYHFSRQFASQLLPVGNGTNWLDVSGGYNPLCALRKDGTFLQSVLAEYASPSAQARVWEPSRYSDWIAIGASWNHAASLAADGTLSYWRDPAAGSRLLGPSRKPVWTVNIFSITEMPPK